VKFVTKKDLEVEFKIFDIIKRKGKALKVNQWLRKGFPSEIDSKPTS